LSISQTPFVPFAPTETQAYSPILTIKKTLIQITFHPSSPYSSCKLNQYNKSGNDGRTNFYGIYGSTPRIAINGTALSTSTNYNSGTIFDPYRSLTSAFEMSSTFTKMGDSFVAEVTIKKVAANSLSTGSLYVFAAEDSLSYNGPNGEKLHHNVYRSSFNEGSINLPGSAGDSTIFKYTISADAKLKIDKMHSIAILQNGKSLIQASRSGASKTVQTNSTSVITTKEVQVYPNPSKGIIHFNQSFEGKNIALFSAQGLKVKSTKVLNGDVNVSELSSGIYSFSILDQNTHYQGKVLIINQ